MDTYTDGLGCCSLTVAAGANSNVAAVVATDHTLTSDQGAAYHLYLSAINECSILNTGACQILSTGTITSSSGTSTMDSLSARRRSYNPTGGFPLSNFPNGCEGAGCSNFAAPLCPSVDGSSTACTAVVQEWGEVSASGEGYKCNGARNSAGTEVANEAACQV